MIVVVVALVVLGPKDLPRALYQLGKWTRHARRITGEFQRHVDDIVRQAELEEVRKTVQDATKQFDIRGQMSEHVNSVLDPVKDIKQAFEQSAPGATPLAEPDKAAAGSVNGHAAPASAEPHAVEGPQPAEEAKPAPVSEPPSVVEPAAVVQAEAMHAPAAPVAPAAPPAPLTPAPSPAPSSPDRTS